MNLKSFKEKLQKTPTTIDFDETMTIIEQLYTFTPSKFENGNITNNKNENNGSCKLFAFAQLQGFSKNETLACFGQFYQEDVLGNPKGEDHQNIRNFINFGWNGVKFNKKVLQEK